MTIYEIVTLTVISILIVYISGFYVRYQERKKFDRNKSINIIRLSRKITITES